MISLFFTCSFTGMIKSALSAVLLTLIILTGIFLTFFISKLLSVTILKGFPSSFSLELPPYRKPQILKTIYRSVFDRTLHVLARAVITAAPAGALIWILANVTIGPSSLLSYLTDFLDPFGRIIGMDGVILMAFILGFPANEIVIPLILMSYLSLDHMTEYESIYALKHIFIENNWTWLTALCVMIFSMFHWPCATTCLTIKKETGSLLWTFAAFLIPTVTGLLLCFLISACAGLFL